MAHKKHGHKGHGKDGTSGHSGVSMKGGDKEYTGTGPIVHGDHIMHARGQNAKDGHASAEYHSKNKSHGMEHGFNHEGDESGHHEQEGIPNTEGNCEYCDD